MQENHSTLMDCFCSGAFSSPLVQWWSSVQLCSEMRTGSGHRVHLVLMSYPPAENGKLSSWGSSHLGDSMPAWPDFQNQFLLADIWFEPSWPDSWGTWSSHSSGQRGNLQRGSSTITCLFWDPMCMMQWKGRAVLLTSRASSMPSL